MMKMTKSLVFCVLVLLLLCSAFADEKASQTKVEKDPVAEEETKQINQGGGGGGRYCGPRGCGGGSGGGGGRYCGPRGCNQGGGGGGGGGGGSYCGRRGCCGGYYYYRGQQTCRRCCSEEPKQINQGEVEPATENVRNSNLDDSQDHGGKGGGQDHGGKGGGQDHGGKGGGQDHGGKHCDHGCCSGSYKGKGCSYCCRSAEEAKAFKASQGEQEPKN